MKLDFLPLDRLSVSKANMRYARRAPDVSDILPTVRARGVLTPLVVRPVAGGAPEAAQSGEGTAAAPAYEILAGSRRYHAARIVADERAAGGEPDPDAGRLPCAILEAADDAAAVEASLIENIARLDPDEVAQWETFTRLIREGRTPGDIAATFGLPALAVRRVLALGNLAPRIRKLYREERIDRATVRHLTLASKSQQKAWLALFDDADAYVPTGHQLKAWLFGGQSISADHALFDLEESGIAAVADLFGDERYVADADAFWRAQNAAIAARREAYLAAGWADAVVVPPNEHFHGWDHVKAGKGKGGRVYIEVRANGEVLFHEGYLTRREARRLEKGEPPAAASKPARPEITGPMQCYIDLHRHAAARAALLDHSGLALRLMVAHAIAGSPLWSVRVEPQAARSDAVMESVETCAAETAFDAKRRTVLRLLGMSAEEPTVSGGNGDPYALVGVFLRLMALGDEAVMDVVAVVIGETLAAGSAAVEALGGAVGLDMARHWQPDAAFLALLRDREVLAALVAEVAGAKVAEANAKEKGKTLKAILRDHLEGTGGRPKIEGWVPRWMAFPPSAYTQRGGIGTLAAHALVEAAREELASGPGAAAGNDPAPPGQEGGEVPAPGGGEPERGRLAA